MVDDPTKLINQNKFYSRILIAAASSIGTKLESTDVHSVVMVGFSTSILEMVQEMGRCARYRTNSAGNVTDAFNLLLTCNDIVYANQRLYLPHDKQ